LMMLSAVIATSLSIVREKERETMEQIMVSPVRPLELIFGKTLPYVVICLATMAMILAMGYLLFGIEMAGSYAMLALATLIMVGMFIAAPHLLTFGVGRLLGVDLDTRGFAFHVVDGFFRIAILLGYIAAIARTEEMRRVFQYHGAEHKAIWAYESGLPLTVENARGFTTLHPRCGTSFLFVVVLVAVLLHVALFPFIPRLHANGLVNQLLMVLVKVPMAFPIAGVAYELQRLSVRPSCPRLILWLTRPGLWMQNITTRQPTDAQLEIAVLALSRSLAREEGRGVAPDGLSVYASYQAASGLSPVPA